MKKVLTSPCAGGRKSEPIKSGNKLSRYHLKFLQPNFFLRVCRSTISPMSTFRSASGLRLLNWRVFLTTISTANSTFDSHRQITGGENAETSTLCPWISTAKSDLDSFLSARNRFQNHFPSKHI